MTTIDANSMPDVEQYIREVSALVNHLEEDERTELLEDLRDHLKEVKAENPERSLSDAIGSPSSYVAELLASAGVAGGADRRPAAAERLEHLRARISSSGVGRYVSGLMPTLQPAWWVIRAGLVVLLILQVLLFSVSPLALILAGIGTLAVIPWSIAIGRAKKPVAVKALVLAADAALMVFGVAFLMRGGEVVYVNDSAGAPSVSGCLTNGGGQLITNLYAYDLSGNLIPRVFIFDSSGKSIDNLCPEFDSSGRQLNTEYAKDVNGAPVYNVFPRSQTFAPDPLYSTAPQPVPPPAVVIPRLSETEPKPPATTSIPTSAPGTGA